MKVGGGHIPVSGDDDVPSGTLAIPHEIADDTLPDRRNVLLADADRAETLLRWGLGAVRERLTSSPR